VFYAILFCGSEKWSMTMREKNQMQKSYMKFFSYVSAYWIKIIMESLQMQLKVQKLLALTFIYLLSYILEILNR
jgi:hypothetical protein